jgi:hypothetical protein
MTAPESGFPQNQVNYNLQNPTPSDWPNLQASWIAFHYPPKKEPNAPVSVTSPTT